jgi:phosphoglycolate phosphatase
VNIVFDLDGTLIDSAPDIHSVAASILDDLGKAPLTLAETRNFVGEGAAVFISRMMAARELGASTADHQSLLQKFLSQYEFAVDKAVFYPGALDTLIGFHAAGRRLGLCTNKPEKPTRAVLRHMGIEALFSATIAGDMLQSRKPDPEMLLSTLEQLGDGPSLYVGDSEIDAETARRAEIPFALFTGGYRKKPIEDLHWDWTFDSFQQLPTIAEEAIVPRAP